MYETDSLKTEHDILYMHACFHSCCGMLVQVEDLIFMDTLFVFGRYPMETMQLVADLSQGIVDSYREKQKGRLQRTFVQASDAAGAKAKGRT
jgi:hypothetical protein